MRTEMGSQRMSHIESDSDMGARGRSRSRLAGIVHRKDARRGVRQSDCPTPTMAPTPHVRDKVRTEHFAPPPRIVLPHEALAEKTRPRFEVARPQYDPETGAKLTGSRRKAKLQPGYRLDEKLRDWRKQNCWVPIKRPTVQEKRQKMKPIGRQ